MRQSWRLDGDDEEGVSFWAAYSDLMAGILLIFAIVAVSAKYDFERQFERPQRLLQEWEKLEKVCEEFQEEDERLQAQCENGTLILTEESLRFGFNSVNLSERGKEVLRQTVPRYLEAVLKTERELIQITSIEISGHTDAPTRTTMGNYAIGEQRAANVLDFLLAASEMEPYQGLLKDKATVVSYADTKPPKNLPPRVGLEWPEARRIEIQVHFDDDAVLEELKQFLDDLKGQ